jgi:hypothetical protein
VINGETRTNQILLGQGITGAGDVVPTAIFAWAFFDGNTYTNLVYAGNPNLLWPAENWIGLRFLARHLVTFNFPKRTLYLRQRSVGPLASEGSFTNAPETTR